MLDLTSQYAYFTQASQSEWIEESENEDEDEDDDTENEEDESGDESDEEDDAEVSQFENLIKICSLC